MFVGEAALAADRQRVDLELVPAVDNSLSVNQREYDLQISGIAEAFRDPDVINAILSHDGVAISVVQWSNHKQQEAGVARSLLHSAAAISTFADQVAAAPRLEVSGGTGLGAAMVYAMRSIETNRFAGDRRVIDVSGDGQNNMGVAPKRYALLRSLQDTRSMVWRSWTRSPGLTGTTPRM